jgi:hypothetical protein
VVSVPGSPFLPLSPAALHILLSLAGEDRHGYGIMHSEADAAIGREQQAMMAVV